VCVLASLSLRQNVIEVSIWYTIEEVYRIYNPQASMFASHAARAWQRDEDSFGKNA
jgi:hypothetical protein